MVATTLEYEAVSAPRRALVLRRSTLLFALGALAGYLWLAPVFVPPGGSTLIEAGISLQRFLRVVSVLFILPLVLGRVLQLPLRERIVRFMLWSFVFAPLFSLLNYPNIDFLIATLGPFLVGGLSLLCLCALKQEEFTTWVFGVGLAAFVFLVLGLSQYGIETTTFYGRSRAAYGFTHPTQSAAAVLMAGIFAVLWIGRRFRKQTRTRMFLWTAAGASTAFLLFLAFSRNTFLVVLTAVLGAGYGIVVKRAMPKFLLGIVFILVPLVLFGVAVFGDPQDIRWYVLNDLSSGRFEVYQDLVSNMNRETILTTLVGPSAYSQLSISDTRGFASSESTYFSLYVNFGLVTLVSFFAFLLYLAKRLSQVRAPLAYGCLCGVTIFFAIDAQGVTPSNLAVFLLLAYCVRYTLSMSIAGKQPRSIPPVVARLTSS